MKGMVFLDIDTQVDFMRPDGALAVSGAPALVPNLRRLLEAAHDAGIPVIASLDTHLPDDPEFETFSPHCIDNTPGHAKIEETCFAPARRIGRESQPVRYREGETLIVEKSVYSLFDNVNADRVLDSVGAKELVVFGVATDYCVKAAALGLRQRGLDVMVVRDAIAAVNDADGARALVEMREAGCLFVETDQVLALLSKAETSQE